ncbi:MAG: hypothetical protein ACI3ZL_02010 [Candidatus Cryptobacteroides sp.]
MKRSLIIFLSAILMVGIALTSCDIANLSGLINAEMTVSAGTVSVDVTLNTNKLTEYAYQVTEPGQGPESAALLFAKGTTGSLSDGENLITIKGLEGNTTYQISVALKVSDEEFYQDILTAEFTTTDYEQTLTLMNTTHDGFSLHFRMPGGITEQNHVVRYSVASLPRYNELKTGYMPYTDADLLQANGQVYWDGDATVVYNNDNIYLYDEEGNPVIDEWTGEPVIAHNQIVPGEPLVFLAGEFGWGESDFGWEDGYYEAAFNWDAYYDSITPDDGGWGPGPLVANEFDDDNFWTGYHERIYFTATPPAPLEAKLNVEIKAAATSGTVKITPEEGVYQYCFFICDDAMYEDMLLPLVNNNEDYVQAFITTVYGLYCGCMSEQGALEIDLEDYAYIEPEMKYHFLITAMGNEEGTTQNFQHLTFVTPQKSGTTPEVVVTALKPDEPSPFAAYFNVKCPTKNAVSGKYAANYVREFDKLLNSTRYDYTYDSIVDQGYSFTADEIAQINSDEGYTMGIPTVPDETTRLAVLLYNDERTANSITGADDSAVADTRSDKVPDAPKVDSPLFTALPGEWTMSADVTAYDYYQGGVVPKGSRSCKVTIAEGVEYPATLSDDVYELYKKAANMDKAAVDALYDEFKEEAEIFNSWLKGQNRLLCLGYGFEDYSTYLEYQGAYDLFVNEDYNGYDNRSLFWDFGPKWYLEIAADGTVSVPANNQTMYTMSGWQGNAIYLAALGEDGAAFSDGGNDLIFPGVVAEDKNTITIKPIMVGENPYYPCAGFNYYGQFWGPDTYINSNLTLTKGWTEPEVPATKASVSAAGQNRVKVISGTENSIPMLRKTPLKALRSYKKASYQIVDKELFQSKMQVERNKFGK